MTPPLPQASQFQGFYSFSEEIIPYTDLNLPWHSSGPFPLILSCVPWEKSLIPTWLHCPVRELRRALKSPLSLLSSRLGPLSCSSPDLCARATVSPYRKPSRLIHSGRPLLAPVELPWVVCWCFAEILSKNQHLCISACICVCVCYLHERFQ